MERKNKWLVPILTMIVVILVFLVGYLMGRTGFQVAWEQGDISYSFKGKLYPEEKDINFDLFWDVWEKLETMYVDKNLDEEDMFYGAIKGLTLSLDDSATRFYTAEETEQYDEEKAGKFEGIGIEMGYLESKVIVKKVFDDTPASKSGLRSGDVIIGVDDNDVRDWDISDIARNIRGEKDTNVEIKVARNGEEKAFDITRGEVYVESVDWEMLSSGIAMITVRRFTESNFTSFAMLWDQVIYEVKGEKPKGIIIDLRGNGGGFLDGATYLGGEFLKEGTNVLMVQDRNGSKESHDVARNGNFLDLPIVILVDYGTASSSEIFAGAMQYHKRALIIGEETFGKGTAQDVLRPSSWGGASIHITTQKWLLPNGRWITEDDPIIPDIEVEITVEQIKEGEDPQLDKAIEEIKKQF